jgi:diacylglycerol kinase family enzyme
MEHLLYLGADELEFREPVSATYYAIVNEAAGGGRCAKLAPEALADLERRGLSLEVAFTEGPKHATDLVGRAVASGFRRFLSVGGDGTAAEVVNGLIGAGVSAETELAMLPLGTGNSFLRDFDITSVEVAVERIARDDSTPIDVLRLTHQDGVIHFLNTMGTGFVARAGELTNERFKFLEANTLRYAATTDEARTVLTSFSNTQYTGGSMRMAPGAEVADGLLDVVRAGTLGRAALIAAFGRIFSGTHTDLDEVWTRQVPHVEFINPSAQSVLIDGDLFHLTPLSIDVLPSALRLIA